METWGLPGYEVLEMLGFGASGEVWRARQVLTGEVVALKRLRRGAGAAGVAALRREAEVLAGLDTPYVVRLREVVREVGSDGAGGDVLVLDHAAGGSLAALLSRRGALEPGEAVTVAVPVAQALAAAHAVGLVHGDVSPANVLFTGDGMPLLSDLGLARVAGAAGALSGTAEYLDPAVAAGAEPSGASDVWALASVCHHVLAGTPPHAAPSVDRVLAAAARTERAPLGLLAPQVPRALVEVVERALAPDPAARPSAGDFAAALLRAQTPCPVRLAGGPPSSAPVPDVRETHAVPRPPRPPAPVPARRRVRPHVVLLAALAAALATALSLSAARWVDGRGGDRGPRALPPVPGPSTSGRAPAGASVSASPDRAGPPAAEVVPPAPAEWAGPVVPAPGPRAPVTTGQAPGPPVPSGSPAGPGASVPPQRPAPAAPAPPDWRAVLARVDGLREQAFAGGDAALLAQVWAAGSAAGAADGASLAALTAQGRTATGVRHAVRVAEQRSWTGDRAQLRVVDELGPQRVRDRRGATVARIAGRGPATYLVDLVHDGDAWSIAAVTPA